MTLEEAIKHCLEVADKNEISAITYKNCKEIKTNIYEKLTAEKAENDCRGCAADHRQLAEWLTELKELKSTYIKSIHIGHWIEHNDCIECSVCGFEVKDPYCEKRDMTCTETSYDFCPKCGSDMCGVELKVR